MSRKNARESLYKLIFEYLFVRAKDETALELMCHDAKLTQDDVDYLRRAYLGVVDNIDSYFETVRRRSRGFSLERVYKADLAAIVLALYEIDVEEDIPPVVSINEAVELVKRYSTDKSNSFVHGILAAVVNDKGDKPNGNDN